MARIIFVYVNLQVVQKEKREQKKPKEEKEKPKKEKPKKEKNEKREPKEDKQKINFYKILIKVYLFLNAFITCRGTGLLCV
jgi:hypothetical protein